MANESVVVSFKNGLKTNLNSATKVAGQVLFALNSDTGTGSIYYDQDTTHRFRMSYDLKDITNSIPESATSITTVANRTYPVALDQNGYLAVNVPWTSADLDLGIGLDQIGTTIFNTGVISIATGSANGTLSVQTGSTNAVDVAVKGLQNIAYVAYPNTDATSKYLRGDGTWVSPIVGVNVSDVAVSGEYVTDVSQVDGAIIVNRTAFSPSITITAGTSSNAPKINVTINGKSGTAQSITIASTELYGVTKLSSVTSSTEETLAATPKLVSTSITSAINALDVADIAVAGEYVTDVSQTDGTITVNRTAFSPSIIITDGTSSATPKINVTVNGKSGTAQSITMASTSVYGATKLSSTASNTVENLAATPKLVSTSVSSAINALDVADIAIAGEYVSSVSQTDGAITVDRIAFSPSISITAGTASVAPKVNVTINGKSGTAQSITTATTGLYGVTKLSSTASSTEEGLAATPKLVATSVSNAINALAVTDAAVNGEYVTDVSQVDGAIIVNRAAFSPSITITAGTSSATPKVNVTVNGKSGTAKSITKASTSVYGATKLSSTASSTEEGLAATPKLVATSILNAINALDATDVAVSTEYVSSISQIDGVVSCTHGSFLDVTVGTANFANAASLNTTQYGITFYTDAVGTFGTTPLLHTSSTGGLEIKGHIAGDANTTGHGLYSGGGYSNAYNNLILHGDATTGTSGIAFISDKITASTGVVTNINQPSDRAFIQYHAYGVTTATAENTTPTLATSGESGRLVIGIGNDATDQLWLQTPSRTGLIHQVATASYVIPDTGNTTGNVGSQTTPVYVSAGVITPLTGTLANDISGNAATATQADAADIISTLGGSAAKFWRGDNSWSDEISGGTLKITNNSNTFNIGSQNASFTHLYNSQSIPFIFNYSVLTITGSLGNNDYPWGDIYLSSANQVGAANPKTTRHIYYKGTGNNKVSMIRFIDQSSTDGYGVSISGNGLVIIGAGESHNKISAGAGTENLYLLSDTTTYVEAGAQSDNDTNKYRGGFSINRNTSDNTLSIVPVKAETETDQAVSLGISGKRWSAVYVGNSDTYGSDGSDSQAINPICWMSGKPVAISGALANNISGNAATATKLKTARTINGTSFNGTANITTANWGTARNISISDSDGTNTGTAVSVNGSAAVTLKLPATIKATLTGNASSATYATKCGTSAIWWYPENSNELNIGGTNTSTTIYIGYRAKDSRSIPTKFIFGSSTGTARLKFSAMEVSNASYGATLPTSGQQEGQIFYQLSAEQYELPAGGATGTLLMKKTAGDRDVQWTPSSVYVSGSVLFGAAWNDFAEFRSTVSNIEPGRVVIENGNDTLSLSTERLQPGAEIVSDTFGFAIGQTEKCNTPIAASGRVLAYPNEPRDTYKPGQPICSGPNGTVSQMTDEEARNYPWLILGTVSAIPDYETWGEDNIEVKGRIWVRIR